MAEQRALIQAMGLSELDTDNDKFIKNGKDYPTRKKLQALVLKSTITDNFFKTLNLEQCPTILSQRNGSTYS